MQRDPARLTARTFDILVVGGGVSGLTIACDAAQRGLSVALIERDDFGSGVSFNHLRTIHGGLRYLQHLDFGRARASMRERRALAHVAPFALRVQPFVLPLTRSMTRGRLAMRAGFLLDSVVAAGRNEGVPSALAIRGGRIISREEAIERFPGMRRQGLTGAAMWSEYTTTEADRLTLSWGLAAHRHGAVLSNHVEALTLLGTRDRVEGVRARDRVSGQELEIAASLTINAAGSARVRLAPEKRLPRLIRALNLVTNRDAGEEALGAPTPSGRHLFMVPWRGRALFGTWESQGFCSSTDPDPSSDEVQRFIVELNQAFPSLELTRDDVTLVHRGLVPGVEHSGGVTLDGEDHVIDHASDGASVAGLLTVAATKYTTARALAERAVDLAFVKLGKAVEACRTAVTPLPGGDLGDPVLAIASARRQYEPDIPGSSIPHLVAAYGSRYVEIADLAGRREEWRTQLSSSSPVIGAQVVHAARHEMAITLADAVIRRTPLGALGCPDDAALERAASIMAGECQWNEERCRQEIADVRRFYVAAV